MARMIEKAVAKEFGSVEEKILEMAKKQMAENQQLMLEKVEELGAEMDKRIKLEVHNKLIPILKLISDNQDMIKRLVDAETPGSE